MRVSDLSIDRVYINILTRDANYASSQNHFHYYYEMFYVKSGVCRFFVNNNLYDLRAGDFLVIPPREVHYNRYLSQCTRVNLYFYASDLMAGASGRPAEDPLISHAAEKFLKQILLHHIPSAHRSNVEDILNTMIREDRVDDESTKEMMSLLLRQLLLQLNRCSLQRTQTSSQLIRSRHPSRLRTAPGPEKTESAAVDSASRSAAVNSASRSVAVNSASQSTAANQPCEASAASSGAAESPVITTVSPSDLKILDASRYIAAHYAEHISLDMLSGRAGMSPAYFSRRFRQVTGMGMKEYLIYVRLRHACLELVSTSHSITEVSMNCGFSDSNYFKDAFRKMYGQSPSAYRKSRSTDSILEESMRILGSEP